MNDELRIRSEGALDEVERATERYLQIERTLVGQGEVELAALMPPSPDDKRLALAMERLGRLDRGPVERLDSIQRRVADLARAQLRARDVEPTATRVEDLLAQLAARANACRASTRSPSSHQTWIVIPFALLNLAAVWGLDKLGQYRTGAAVAVLGCLLLGLIFRRSQDQE